MRFLALDRYDAALPVSKPAARARTGRSFGPVLSDPGEIWQDSDIKCHGSMHCTSGYVRVIEAIPHYRIAQPLRPAGPEPRHS